MDDSDSVSQSDIGSRRHFLGGAGAAAALTAMSSPATAARPRTSTLVGSPLRARYTISGDFSLPGANVVTTLPLSTTLMQESADVALQTDGRVLVRTTGQYRLILGCDWVAQAYTDIDRRMIGIRRAPGHLPSQDDRLASVDIPASDPPTMARYQGEWTPGFVAMGNIVTTDITVSPAGIVKPGDLALASHTSITDSILGATAVGALITQARVVAADKIRISVYNPMIPAGVDIPSGTLNVLGMNAVERSGRSNDAWQMLHTATEDLTAGEYIYAVVRTKTKGDYVQATRTTFLQIERFG